jgi:UDP-N-acetyl-D-mannosaminuronic acid dehydrogenase
VLIVLVDHDVFRVVPFEERSRALVYDTRGIWPDAGEAGARPAIRLAG